MRDIALTVDVSNLVTRFVVGVCPECQYTCRAFNRQDAMRMLTNHIWAAHKELRKEK